MNSYRTLKVALLGAGSVGAQVARLLLEHSEAYASRIGATLELTGIAVRNLEAERDVDLPAELFTTDAEALVQSADFVVELIGGIHPAKELITLALSSGADVVTANKALLAHHGAELFELAERVGAQFQYEAAVAGAIPILRPLRDNLAGDQIARVLGIVNGTTNFILDRMHTRGASLEESMRVAGELGYLEADPSADVEGYDAQQKAAILASIAFHTHMPVDEVYREGITKITSDQIAQAERAGYVVKLLAICERVTDEHGAARVAARVHPALVPASHPLANVHGANNAIFVQAEAAGSLMFYGAGAGGVETASSVLGDLVSIARRHVMGGPGLGESMQANLPVLPATELRTRYQISLDAHDQPGVLARIATIFERAGVSVETLEQSTPASSARVDGRAAEVDDAEHATLVIVTHEANEGSLAGLVRELADDPAVAAVKGVLRVESLER